MKIFSALIICIMLTPSIYAADLQRWDTLPKSTRETLVKQYITGYLAGMNRGISEGIHSVISYTKKTGESTYIDPTPNIYTSCSNLVNSNIDRIYDETAGWQQLQTRDTTYYIYEMNTFLKTYPQCNRIAVPDLIEILAPIWLNVEKKTSYEEVGLGCGK